MSLALSIWRVPRPKLALLEDKFYQLLRDIILSFSGITRKSSAMKDHSAASSPHPSPNDFYFLSLVFLHHLQDNQNDHNPGTPGEGDNQFSNLLPFSQDNVSDMLFLVLYFCNLKKIS